MKSTFIAALALAAVAAAQDVPCTVQLHVKMVQHSPRSSVPIIKCSMPPMQPKECFDRANAFAGIYKDSAFADGDFKSFYDISSSVDLSLPNTITEFPTICGIYGGKVEMPESW
ncbi:hypothetical protein DFQ27_003816 [Actinomortierella ambigua]|uniref:Uncharacterized protein n=1 Tax=Actinomortierella ambigua TaxID=1343610 RepID=A0A9P6Q6T1_9FUNG|nr:hypothetical protein DFQ27_003816 [Actinomortierella ambigua]